MPSFLHKNLQDYLLKKLSYYSPRKEVVFESINRKADIVVASKKLVFEIQCSPISHREIELRNAAYQQRGYRTIWILHTRTFGKRFLTNAEKYLLGREHYYSNLTEHGGDIYCKVWFPKKSWLYYREPVQIETVNPFIHTAATKAVRPFAQYYCKGDIVDLLLSQPETAEELLKSIRPYKNSWFCRFRNTVYTLIDAETEGWQEQTMDDLWHIL